MSGKKKKKPLVLKFDSNYMWVVIYPTSIGNLINGARFNVIFPVLMEFSCPEVSGQKPTARSWHSSSLLEGNRLLIHGGFDGSSDQVLGDSFIFDIGMKYI